METLRKRTPLVALFVCLASIGLYMDGHQVIAQNGPPPLKPSPATPVQIVGPLPVPVTGDVAVTGNVALAPGASVNITNPATSPVPVTLAGPVPVTPGIEKRYNQQLFNTTGIGDEIVPPVPAGQTFIATYFNVVGFSNISGADLTDGSCDLRLQAGSSNSPFGSVPLRVNRGTLAGSETAFLPINAGESLFVVCFSRPTATASSFWAIVGGHFVPAP